jgi:outer membrane protein OmpA-like peptidoglycan-associated protein
MKKLFAQALAILGTMSAVAQPGLENLGAKVNSIYAEARPTISADGKILYFIVEGNPKNSAYKNDKDAQDVWYSELDESGAWGQAVQAGSPINATKDNAIFWVSPDGNRILIRGNYDNGKFIGPGFSICKKVDGGWSNPEGLKITNYTKLAIDQYSGAAMSNDGKTLFLYFSEEKNSFLNDIYVSRLNEETEQWSAPTKIGGGVNTDDYDEISPFFAADGVTLYFASNRPGGVGDYDIWMTKRLSADYKAWSQPVNMGDSINSPKWDAYFSVDAKGEYGYVAAYQNALGGTDIFRTKLSESQRPKTVVLVYGKVYNAITKEVMDAKLEYNLIPGESNEGNAISSPEGNYKVTLPYGKKYSIRASADKFFSVIDTIDLSVSDIYKEMHRDLYLTPVVEDGKVIKDSAGNIVRTSIDSLGNDNIENADALKEGQILSTNNILFDFSKSILRAEAYAELDKVARMLKATPTMQVELSAHTDAVGGYSENLKLSEDRAYAAKQYLMSKGIAGDRIISKGYGETTPIGDNKTEIGRQQNRRVEFRILKK